MKTGTFGIFQNFKGCDKNTINKLNNILCLCINLPNQQFRKEYMEKQFIKEQLNFKLLTKNEKNKNF
jgi:hypothetical protein